MCGVFLSLVIFLLIILFSARSIILPPAICPALRGLRSCSLLAVLLCGVPENARGVLGCTLRIPAQDSPRLNALHSPPSALHSRHLSCSCASLRKILPASTLYALHPTLPLGCLVLEIPISRSPSSCSPPLGRGRG